MHGWYDLLSSNSSALSNPERNITDGTRSLLLNQSVLQTVLRGLKHRNELAQENAITLLDCVCARSLGQAQSESRSGSDLTSVQDSEVRKLTLLSDLLGNIAKLGKKNTKQGKEALGTVRKALRVFCRYGAL